MIKHKFFKYFFGGFLTFGVNLSLTFVLTEFFNIFYLHSYIFSFSVSVGIGFFLNQYYVFVTNESERFTFPKYFSTVLFFLIINPGLIFLLTSFFQMYYISSVILTTLIAFTLKYIIYDSFVFKNDTI